MRIIKTIRRPDPLNEAITLGEYKRLERLGFIDRPLTSKDIADSRMAAEGFGDTVQFKNLD